MRVSDDVLERICHTLRLSDDERVYLFSLVQHRAPRVRREEREETERDEAPTDVVRLINALNVPAIAMNLRWDVLAENRLNSVLYRDYGAIPPEQRNLLEILLSKPVRHLSPKLLEHTARRVIARLRFDYSRHPDDPQLRGTDSAAGDAIADLPPALASAGVHAAGLWDSSLSPSPVWGSGVRAHVLRAGWAFAVCGL